MQIDNHKIAAIFSLLSKVMEIHGENSFKTRSYSAAAFTIDKLSAQLYSLPEDKIFSIKGIGDAIGKKIMVILETGQLPLLNQYLEKTPPAIVEMLGIKGLGPGKIATIWQQMGIESIGELLYACNENRLVEWKGFGAKTQQNIKDAITFYLGNQGSALFADARVIAHFYTGHILKRFPGSLLEITGQVRRQLETIDQLEWVTDIEEEKIATLLKELNPEVSIKHESSGKFLIGNMLPFQFYPCAKESFHRILLETSSSPEFLRAFKSMVSWKENEEYKSEEEIFAKAGISHIPPCLREDTAVLDKAKSSQLPSLIEVKDICGLIHCHSTWSDGANTLEEMAMAAKAKGMQYMVISDHSKTAVYARGLNEERIIAQQEEIEHLNNKLSPFRIFKSIESDILNDGSLDYSPEVLNSFDIVIASIHSNLKMDEEKAMMRLLKAIENPYTSIIGHPTGRLLLSRSGYPVDHKVLIDACAANNVVIELNANPRRLDMDWRWIRYALEKNVLVSIDPDAHSIIGIDDVEYGVLVAQKSALSKEQNLSSFSLPEFEVFVKKQKEKRDRKGH